MSTADPFLDEGMKGFIVNTARREYWRVAELCDFPDLVQDGYLCYCKCKVAYPPEIFTKDAKKQFQNLVKVAFTNHISTLAAKRKGVSEKPISQFVVEGGGADDFADQYLEPQPELGPFMALLANAPAELKQLIQLLANDGQELFAFQRKRNRRRHIRETTNEFYCRVLGKDPTQVDIAGQLRSYFGV